MAANGDITYREWAPNATQAFLTGDFSESPRWKRFCSCCPNARLADDWSRDATPMKRDNFGVWEVVLPAKAGTPAIAHNTKVKVHQHPDIFRCLRLTVLCRRSPWFCPPVNGSSDFRLGSHA